MQCTINYVHMCINFMTKKSILNYTAKGSKLAQFKTVYTVTL